jgi:ribosome-associated protein
MSKEKSAKKFSLDQLKNEIIRILEDNKAEDIEIIDLKGKTDIASLMIIASGRVDRHVKSISLNLSRELKKLGTKHQLEGLEQKDWVLIDCYDIIVHVFRKEAREYYKLEELWTRSSIAQ